MHLLSIEMEGLKYMRFSSLSKLAVLAFSVGMGLSSHAFADGITATATFTDTPNASLPGVNDYSITLNNTGTTTIGTFWFAWVPGAGFLSATPTDIGSSQQSRAYPNWVAQRLFSAHSRKFSG